MTIVDSHMRESLEGHILEQVLDAERFKAFYMKRPGSDQRMMSTLIMFTPEGIVITGDLCPRMQTGGVISDLGYGLNWFSGKLSEGYLCEKFMQQGWYRELAEGDLRKMVKDIGQGEYDDYGWTGELREASEERRGLSEELKDAREDLRADRERGDEEAVQDRRRAIEGLREDLRPLRQKVVKLRAALVEKVNDLLQRLDWGDMDQMGFGDRWREINADAEWVPGWGYPPGDAGWLCAIQNRFAELYQVRSSALAVE